jgi:hypothetical protein
MARSRFAPRSAAGAALAAVALLAAAAFPHGPALGQEKPADPFANPGVGAGSGSGPAPAAGEPSSAGETVVREPLAGGAPEIAACKSKVVFCVDRSGSMGIADRFYTALDVVDQLLREMPASAQFDIYLVDHGVHSLFQDSWMHGSEDVRKSLRSKIDKAGGLNFGGFTDFVSAVKQAADRRRPDAVYLLTDGVETLGDVDTEKIVAAIAKTARGVKIPVHTIGIALGADTASEDKSESQAVLRGIAEATGGVFRETKSVAGTHTILHRAFRLNPPSQPQPAEDLARVKILTTKGEEIRYRQLSMDAPRELGDVVIEIEDPTVQKGPIALEYADPKLFVRTFLPSGKQFVETFPVPLKVAKNGSYVSSYPICFVSPTDDTPWNELTAWGALPVKVTHGGSVEFVYRRAGREFKEAAIVVPQPPPGTSQKKHPGQ